MPKNTHIPERITIEHDKITQDVILLVNQEFKDHPGDASNLCLRNAG